MLSNQGGSNLRLKRGRSRSRGRPSKQPTSAVVANDSQRMTRSRSRSRGRVSVTVQQQGENREGTFIGSPANNDVTSRLSGSSGLVFKTTRSSTTSKKALQGPRSESLQEASSSSPVGMRRDAVPSLPYNFSTTTAPRRMPVVEQKKPKPSSAVPYGLPMFSFLSTPNPANQVSRKRPQESAQSMNFGKRRNSVTDELPGCRYQTTRDWSNNNAKTNARSNQFIVSPLNRLFNESSINHTPPLSNSSHSQYKMQRLSSYPDIEIIPVSPNDSSNYDGESHLVGPAQMNKCKTEPEEPAGAIFSYTDSPIPAVKRIPFPIRNERPISTNSKNSSGRLHQKQARSIPDKKADQETGTGTMSISTRMWLNDEYAADVTITPVINITDDEDDDCATPTTFNSGCGADDEVAVHNSEEAVGNHVLESIPGSSSGPATLVVDNSNHDDKSSQEQITVRNNVTLIGGHDYDDEEEEEEYHDTFEEVDEHEPMKDVADEDKIKPKNWCTIA